MWLTLGGLVVAAGLLAGLVYWAIVITEGTYLGRRAVIWLYDRGAHEYDDIKAFDIGDEAWFLGQPLERALSDVPHPLVLDVATGTARLPLALLRRLNFDGTIVGLDLSWEMLCQARPRTAGYGDRLMLVWKDATSLPFINGAFDAVTCLEALEFLPDARATLREMVRVLRPGGVWLVTNRIGRDAPFFFGRHLSSQQFEELLRSLGLEGVKTQHWQEDYDLVWGRKRGRGQALRRARGLVGVLCCPACGVPLSVHPESSGPGSHARFPVAWELPLLTAWGVPLSTGADSTFECPHCQRDYHIYDGIIMLEGRLRNEDRRD